MNIEVTKHYYIEPISAGELSQYGDTSCDFLILDQKEIDRESCWQKADTIDWPDICKNMPEEQELYLVYEIEQMASVLEM